MPRRRALPGFVCLLWSTGLCAQDLRFQHLTTDDGLSDNAITCVYEDRAGYIWIGTENGLDRYDGQRVEHAGGIEEHIAAFLEDRQGTRWIATRDHGLLRWDAGAGPVRRFHHDARDPRSIASDQLTTLYDLDDTTLLIGSRQVPLIFCDKRTHVFTYWTDSTSLAPAHASARPTAPNGWCHAIIPLSDERLWIGLLNHHETLIVDRRNADVLHHIHVERPGSETQTNALLKDGVLYNGGWQNGVDVIRMDAAPLARRWAISPYVIDIPEETTSLVDLRDGRILAGTRALGLFVIDPASGRASRRPRSRYPSALLSDRIRCLFRDRHGTLWVGTDEGLSRHVPSVWNTDVLVLNDEADQNSSELLFHRVEQLEDGALRIYTSAGLFLADSALRSIRHEPVMSRGMSLQPTVMGWSHEGRALLGTEYGIVGYDPVKGVDDKVVQPNDGLGHAYSPGTMFQVRGIWADRLPDRPVLIIATVGYGLTVIDARSGRMLGVAMPAAASASNTRNLVNSVVRTTDGTYWGATADGIFRWHRSEPLTIATPRSADAQENDGIIAPGEDVRQILSAGDRIWAVTRNGQLLKVNHGQARSYVPPSGMRTAMHGLTADLEGRLWITTDEGLLRFDPRDSSFLHVPVNDDRRFRELTPAITTLSDGRIAFCADNALLTLHPGDYDALPTIPVPYVTATSLAGRPVASDGGRVTLSYRASVIDIGVSALAYDFPRPLIFEYRLEGVEEDWRTVSAREMIRYAGVPVGAYRLLVRVRDAFGRAGPEHTLLEVRVNGPLWQQWWFYAIALMLVSSALYAFYNYRLAQAMKLQAVRNRIASDLHDEVGSSLSSITIGAQLAARLAPDGNDQMKKLLQRMGETSSESLRSISDIVWAIDPKNDEGEALLKRMRRIAQELLESKGIDVSFDVGPGVEELKLPMNARKEIVLIFKEAVHNASKYSGASLVHVALHRRNGSLAVSVKDDGKGFDIALHPDGHGLGNMKRRAVSLGAELTLNSAPGMGTLVGVEVDLTRIRD